MQHPSHGRSAFTLVELLVVIAVIGILIALLIPAVQAARESARTVKCRNNLRQIGLATSMFHDVYGAFPPARIEPRLGDVPELSCGGNQLSWLVRILPYIEQGPLAEQWDVYERYDRHPEDIRTVRVPLFLCPSRRNPDKAWMPSQELEIGELPCGCPIGIRVITSGILGDYAGNHGDPSPGAQGIATDFYYGGNGTGVIISSRARCRGRQPFDWVDRIQYRDLYDGASHTMLAGESHVTLKRLGRFPEDAPIFDGDHLPAFARIGGPGAQLGRGPHHETGSLFSFGSWHRGVCHFVLADASVRPITNTVDTRVLGAMCHRNDSVAISVE